jgi:TnpA family transposase
VTERDLLDVYTPSRAELDLARQISKGDSAKRGFLILLKTFQRLGYFVMLQSVPKAIVEHIAAWTEETEFDPAAYDESGTRRRHVTAIRAYLNINPYDLIAEALLGKVMAEAALTKEALADIINVGIEELIRQRYELPGFSTLLKLTRQWRTEINQRIYHQVNRYLGEAGRTQFDALLKVEEEAHRSLWDQLKTDPEQPTLTQLRAWVRRLQWLTQENIGAAALADIPRVKVQHFAREARSLDAAQMKAMQSQKRYTLMAALIKDCVARTLDDLGEMFIKRIRKIHHKGKAALDEYRQKHQAQTDQLIMTLHDLVVVIQQDDDPEQKLAALQLRVGDNPDEIISQCREHNAYTDNNYMPFLWPFYISHRQTLFSLFDHICVSSTSQDRTVEHALQFLLTHRHSKAAWLSIDDTLDLSWVPEKWWKLVTGLTNDKTRPNKIDRRPFEVCVFSQVMQELMAGDLCIEGSDQFADYRAQLISWDEYDRMIDEYSEQIGLPVNSQRLVAETKQWLETVANATDASFSDNNAVRFENGEVILSRIGKQPKPQQLKILERLIADAMEPVSVPDILVDTEHWLNWTRFFRPLSGHDSKLSDPIARYIIAAFCYGCNLGPSQTARAIKDIDRRQIAWIDHHHITEEQLDEAITAIINAYNVFALPKHWGSGKSASADGTKWDVYEQNLLSEYHIRYGGYGGIGYYHVSDTYIALFSHFIPCGVWEAVYILDGLLKNKSDIQPDTLHGDTQAQSAPVFGLAHLLGIKLMPRIRNWKDLKLYRPSKQSHYHHIDSLFDDAIDWQLIETHLPDLLRVVLSIKAGRITASTLLRKLGTYSRKNKLYQAMRELGRVVRTEFLLRYLSDSELRRTIQAATNKSEAYNNFTQWLAFGDDLLAENNRDQQRKLIKYNHLVANCVIFHNVQSLTRILQGAAQNGMRIDAEVLARLSPYLTEHINRFGSYLVNLNRAIRELHYELGLAASN